MELRDIIVTPLIIILVYAGAYIIRPWVTDGVSYKYFFPALTVRIFCALALGLLYQFYYGGGDTLNYHLYGSRIIWDAFTDDPAIGWKLLFSSDGNEPGLYEYTSRSWYFRDPHSFFLIKIAAALGVFTFSTYSATAVLFATVGFAGAWAMFRVFYQLYPDFHRWIAFSCLFIPTVVFWGSGLLKDTITLSALGFSLYIFFQMLIRKRISLFHTVMLLIMFWIIFSIKKYVLLCFLPAILIWAYAKAMTRVKSLVLNILIVPVALIFMLAVAYYGVSKVGEGDPRYNLESLPETARMTSYDIRYGWGARTGEGSGYTLGNLDGTWQSMVRLSPAAVIVSLFRPYPWEVRNPLMLLSALESLGFLILTLFVVYRIGIKGLKHLLTPEIIFCFVFSITFAFAVGVSTFNFGTLSRYKIPLLPFYALGLGLLYYHSKREKKLEELDITE